MASHKTIAADVRNYLKNNWTCFRDPELPHRTFAEVNDNGKNYVFVLESELARQYLARKFIGNYSVNANESVFKNALEELIVRAKFSEETHQTAIRVGMVDDKIYLDLANELGEVVEVDAAGWRTITNAPIKFVRMGGMRALPNPTENGDLNQLWNFVNLPDAEDKVLLGTWLIKTLYPVGPTPILFLNGEAGSAKSTLSTLLNEIVDPKAAPIRSMPRNERDLVLNASGCWIQCFDNLRGISDQMSDALCRLCTGSGYFFPTGNLADGGGETLFVKRPVILNSVDEVAIQSDLLDRTVSLTLPKIDEKTRQREGRFWPDFRKQSSSILGGLLTALSKSLGTIPTTTLESKPRMADFATVAVAAEKALGFGAGSFIKSFEGNRGKADELVIDCSGVGAAVREMMMSVIPDTWEGTSSDLLYVLDDTFAEHLTKRGRVPETPRMLSGMLRRVAPNLRRVGFDVTFHDRTADERRISIVRTRQLTDTQKGYLRYDISENGRLRKPDRKSFDIEQPTNEDQELILRELVEAVPPSGQAPGESKSDDGADGADGADGISMPSGSMQDIIETAVEPTSEEMSKPQKRARKNVA